MIYKNLWLCVTWKTILFVWSIKPRAGVLRCYGAHEEIVHNLRSPTINFNAVIASLDSWKISQVSILISKRIARGAPRFLSRSPGAPYGALWEPMPYGASGPAPLAKFPPWVKPPVTPLITAHAVVQDWHWVIYSHCFILLRLFR